MYKESEGKEAIVKVSMNLPKFLVDYVDKKANENNPRLNRQQMFEKIVREYQTSNR